MKTHIHTLTLSVLVGLTLLAQAPLAAQSPIQPRQPANDQQDVLNQLPQIADEPRAIDPSKLLPPNLAKQATQDFSDSSLREVVGWLQDEQGIMVLVDKVSLNEIGISPAEPVSDRLDNAPIYLLLNRLKSLGLGWYYDDDVLYITSVEMANNRATTLPYNVGDLIDAGYDLERLVSVITLTIEPDSWDDAGGIGALNKLGDVLFVRQADEQQRSVDALLQALRNHSRQTYLNDPPQHREIRERLQANVSVDFTDTPLESAIEQLAANAMSDIRLDRPALRDARIREREPVTLKLTDRKLKTVLEAIVLDLNLTWILRDGVLWLTTPEVAEGFLRTAVYDVRDLCRDEDESQALMEAIVSQANPESWSDLGGVGEIDSAKPGTLVVTHQEQVHQEVLLLLETYRTALRSSKIRDRGEEENEVITVYYRLHTNIARDLSELLPSLVRMDTWNSEPNDDKPGKVFVVSSEPDFSKTGGQGEDAVVVERSVLIIRQTRAAHKEIASIIGRVKSGDAPVGGLGGGMGGGGFGGGFFSIPPARTHRHENRRGGTADVFRHESNHQVRLFPVWF